MLGSYLKKQFPDAVCYTSKELDLSTCTYKDLKWLLQNLKKDDVVINAAGVIPQSKKTNYWRVNSDFPILLGNICRVNASRFIHVSTDCVFSGKKGNYDEDDLPDSESEYGKSKSLGEDAYATIVTTSIIGEESKNKYSLLEWVKSNSGKTINGFKNHLWNGMTCWQLSKIIRKIVETNTYWIGKRHFFSPRNVTKSELVQIISDVYDLEVNVNVVDDLVSKNMTLATNFELMEDIPDIHEQIVEMSTLILDS